MGEIPRCSCCDDCGGPTGGPKSHYRCGRCEAEVQKTIKAWRDATLRAHDAEVAAHNYSVQLRQALQEALDAIRKLDPDGDTFEIEDAQSLLDGVFVELPPKLSDAQLRIPVKLKPE